MEAEFQARIARAKEAARLASLAAMAREHASPPSVSASTPATMPPNTSATPSATPLGHHHHHHHTHQRPPSAAPSPTAPHHAPFGAIPEDVVQRIDRLVEFIQRNGPAFEETARVRERHNPEFAFLWPGAPHHDYFLWRRQSVCGSQRKESSTGQGQAALPVNSVAVDTMQMMSVGAMANVCKLAKLHGLPSYTPLPPELLQQFAATASRVEPARLEIRLAEFYRAIE